MEAAKCKRVKSLKEQEIRSKYQGHNTMFIYNAVVGAIPVISRVDGGVARQQQLDGFDATSRTTDGEM